MLDQGFAAFEPWRDTILEQEESERHKLGRKITMEEDWLRYGISARRTRNQRRLAELHALRRQHREHRAATGTASLEAAQAELSGRLASPRRVSPRLLATISSCATSPPESCGELVSALSARTAPARPP